MTSIGNVAESVLIRIFRGAIVFLMSLALLSALGLGGFAGYQFMQKPKAIEQPEVVIPPQEPIAVDGYINKLRKIIKESERTSEEAIIKAVSEPAKTEVSIKKMHEEASALYLCSINFSAALGLPGGFKSEVQHRYDASVAVS